MFVRWQKRKAKGGPREGHAADARDEAHCIFYTHEMLPSGGSPTVVENQPALHLSIPSVHRAWVLSPLSAADTQDGFRAPTVLQPGGGLYRRRVLIYVHGWKQNYRRTLPMADLMRQHLGGRPAPARAVGESDAAFAATDTTDPPCIIMFAWPARRSSMSYAKARANAVVAGERLRQLITELQLAKCRVAVYGHSMGCRVILHALSTVEMVAQPVEGALLAAAAVSEDALSADASFPLSRIGAKEVTVFYSGHDEALGAPFQAAELWATSGAEGKKALGLHGHVDESKLVLRDDQVFEQIDMQHLAHNPFGYVCDQRVVQAASEAVGLSADLVRRLSLVSSRDTLPDEASDEEGPEFWQSESAADLEPQPEPEPDSAPQAQLRPQMVQEVITECDVTQVAQGVATAALTACGGDTRQLIEKLLDPSLKPDMTVPKETAHKQ